MNREKWNTDNFEKVKRNPQEAAQSIGRWLSNHDPEQYAYDNWQACMSHIVRGTPFQNSNLPPGYTYKPWTMDELMEAATEDGQMPTDPGDWD